MAYKIVDADALDSALDALADSIRNKSDVKGALSFPEPNEFKSAVDMIQTIINGTNPTTITSNGNHATGGYSHVQVDVPTGITPIGNLTDAIITRSSGNNSHVATIPAGYYTNESFTIKEWASGQIAGSGSSGTAFTIPYSSIGFIPKWVALFYNTGDADAINANSIVLAFISNGSSSRLMYRKNSSTVASSTSYNATMNSSGVSCPTYGGSTTKYGTGNYRWYALR